MDKQSVRYFIEKYRATSWLMSRIIYYLFPKSSYWQNDVNEAIATFVPEERRRDRKYVARLKKDVLFSNLHYKVLSAQYFLFDFEKRSDAARKEYLGRYEMDRKIVGWRAACSVWKNFKDKYCAWQAFKKWYRRELVRFGGEEDRAVFDAFVDAHSKFMLKAINKGEGEDVYMFDLNEPGAPSKEDVYKKAVEIAPCVLEEYVQQSDVMAAFHPESVNTVRLITGINGDNFVLACGIIRIGCGSSRVDNAGAGGLAALIDLETGVVMTPGLRENGEKHIFHPDTGTQIIGAQIPQWQDLKKMVEELARVFPEQKYVGWDFAHTDGGWIMIEGNDGAAITAAQMCRGRGLRPEVEEKTGF